MTQLGSSIRGTNAVDLFNNFLEVTGVPVRRKKTIADFL